jgi:hypothetical protein
MKPPFTSNIIRPVGHGLSGFRLELADAPREWSSWQVAMRSFPPKLRSFGNPGGINLSNPAGTVNDKQALYSVPSMWTAATEYRDAGLWPVGSATVIRNHVDTLLNEVNQNLYGGRGLPRMAAVQAGSSGGRPFYAEVPVDGLDAAAVARLREAAGRGVLAFGEQANALLTQSGVRSADSDLTGRAIRAASEASGTIIAAATRGGQSNAAIANQVLQGLSAGMLAVAPSIPFGIGYAVAGVLQIAAWAAGSWDHGVEPAEFAGYSYYWDDAYYRRVLRWRVLVQTCADRAALDQIAGMPIEDASQPPGSCKQWLMHTAYGLDNLGGKSGHEWTQAKSDRAVGKALDLATRLGDPLEDATMIDRIGTYLRYVGASNQAAQRVQRWLWDSRRIERINQALTTGEIDPHCTNPEVVKVGRYPDYWRDWAYRGLGMTPGLYTRADLRALHDSIRNRVVRAAPAATISQQAIDMARIGANIQAFERARRAQQQTVASSRSPLLPMLLVGAGGVALYAYSKMKKKR